MTFAAWTILAAAILPLLCTVLAKYGGRGGYDNNAPRASLDALSGWRQRADWAQRNHYEAFGPFAASVLVAQWARAPQGQVDVLAAGFIAVRVLYSIAYIAGWGAIRTVFWALGFVCVVLLFCAGLR